jgi:hypothetical protein
MIDVHPPEHAAHSWRDFLIHIATIVVGLLIAIGLEQMVEHLHERHQLHELRQGAVEDGRVYVHDVDQLRAANSQVIEDLDRRIGEVRDAAAHRRPLPPATYRPALPTNTIRLANLSAARASGLLHLLSEREIAAATEGEVGVARFESLKETVREARRNRLAFEQRFQVSFPDGPQDFSSATPAQLDEYMGLLLNERVRRAEAEELLNEMHRGGEAFVNGERDLEKMRGIEVGVPSPR